MTLWIEQLIGIILLVGSAFLFGLVLGGAVNE